MVQFLIAALSRGEDATGVEFECEVEAVNGDCDGPLLKQGDDRAWVVDLSVLEACSLHEGVPGGHGARAAVGFEGRVRLGRARLPIVEGLLGGPS